MKYSNKLEKNIILKLIEEKTRTYYFQHNAEKAAERFEAQANELANKVRVEFCIIDRKK